MTDQTDQESSVEELCEEELKRIPCSELPEFKSRGNFSSSRH